MYSVYIRDRVMKLKENDLLKNDLNAVLKKHGIGVDEAMMVLDEIFYDKYNGHKSMNCIAEINGK